MCVRFLFMMIIKCVKRAGDIVYCIKSRECRKSVDGCRQLATNNRKFVVTLLYKIFGIWVLFWEVKQNT